MKYLILLVLAICLIQLSSGRLLVHKSVLNNEYIVGRDVVVNIEIFNVGDEAAYDVTLTDKNFGTEYFETVLGFPSASWQKLAPGSSIAHSFVVKPIKEGIISGGYIEVSYKEDLLSQPTIVRNVDAFHYRIVKFSEILLKESPHLLEWSIFGLLALIPISIPFFSWSLYQLSFENGIRKGSKLYEAIKGTKGDKKKKNK